MSSANSAPRQMEIIHKQINGFSVDSLLPIPTTADLPSEAKTLRIRTGLVKQVFFRLKSNAC